MENVVCELQGGKSLKHRFSNVNMHQNPLGAERKFRLLGLPQSLGFSGPGKGPEKLHFCQFLGAAKAAGLGSTLEAREGASTCGAPIMFSTNLEPVKGGSTIIPVL